MFFKLAPLPYEVTDLEPYISKETINFHYNKHHLGYLNNLNNLVESKYELHGKPLEEIIKLTAKNDEMIQIFNNAAQVYNHSFYWNCMTKNHKTLSQDSSLMQQIVKDFSSYENFISTIKSQSISNFGSGWTWLVFNKNEKKLQIIQTKNADTPITKENLIPLLTIDVWEHAYYLDYQNKRNEYVTNFFDKLINWVFVEENFTKVNK